MYSGPLLKTGNLRDYTALGEIGQPVYAAADQIRTAVLHQIGRDAADLFAVPKFDAVGRNIDWYATQDGDIVPWDAASPEERDAARRRLLELNERIEAHARRIVADPQSNDQRVFGRLLSLCPFIPDSTHIFIVKGQPVLTFWGFVPAGADPSRHRLADIVQQEPAPRAAAATPVAPAAAAGVAATAVPVAAGASWWRWLWWLLGLLLLLLLLLVALRSCDVIEAPVPYLNNEGIVWPGETPPDNSIVTVPGGTVTVPGGTVPGGTIDGTTNGTVVVPNGTVDPNAPVTPDATSPDATSPDAASPDATPEEPNAPNPVQNADTANSDQPNPDQQNPDQPKPDAQTPPPDLQNPDQQNPDQQNPNQPNPDQQTGAQQPPIKPIELPADGSASNGPADFMQGQWRSQTGLRTSGSNAPATIGYDFDKQGKGTTTLKLGNGVTCSGASAATTQNGKLTIQDQGGLNCSDGSNFQGSTVECSKAADGKTRCVGRYPNGQTYDILLGQ